MKSELIKYKENNEDIPSSTMEINLPLDVQACSEKINKNIIKGQDGERLLF